MRDENARAFSAVPVELPPFGPLRDSFGRVITKLRLSVTDRCNFRCLYCLPRNTHPTWQERKDLLTFEEIERTTRILARMGVDRIRLTGGEPLLRTDLPDLVRRLAAVPGIGGISLTTNGYHLSRQVAALKEAGLSTVNISLDSLIQSRFATICEVDGLERVRHAMASALELGLLVKVNCVVIRGINDDEIESIALLAKEFPYEVRFIEFMPFDGAGLWSRSRVVPSKEVLHRISRLVPLRPLKGYSPGPARAYLPAGWAGKFGVIPSVTQPFCETCNRLRLTAEGRVVTCLFGREPGNDLRTPLRSGWTDEAIERHLRGLVSRKPAGCAEWINRSEAVDPAILHSRHIDGLNRMHALGG